ncbi:aminotransferase class V-fold PLP-dependent enzyme [Chitinimonas viridis]|uniref:Aminotransferase class V-fold PLP-dependent enzyme n=1 Tax=Chitinimonas viridis TaxID=664880 RepID=A0ABT8B356_9NEIS|nr:aminotransferase class V-fold PLP-dependent enzyme [Chitinimonas viridis]MDN3576669.1 aminotransferase class V-fold PLP-dependent enzyme [Chitinimonas viridis]
MFEAMRGDGLAWPIFEEEVHTLRQRIAQLIGAKPEQIALMPNASTGTYQVASTLAWSDRPGLVHASHEFPSIAHVWLAQTARGAQPVSVDCTDGHAAILANYLTAIGPDTRLVSVPLASYAEGKRLPVTEIGLAARNAGARLFVDAYQALGVADVNVDALGCDYLVGGCMKYLLGLPGVAFLYVREACGNDIDPQLTGWLARRAPFDFNPSLLDYPDTATRFETGTPPIPAIYAANIGLSLLLQLEVMAIESHVASLVEYATRQLLAMGECLTYQPRPGEHGAHLALYDPTPTRLTAFLQEHAITVSPRGKAVRISFHYFNLMADVDRLCSVLRRYRAQRGNEATRHTEAVMAAGATK